MSYSGKHDKGDLNLNVRLHRFGSQFRGAFPDFSRPDPIGFYSINEAREFQDNANNSSYLHMPHIRSLPLDLNAGIENVQRKSIDPDYHDVFQLCQYIYNHQELLCKSSTGCLQLPVDFVTLRGILRKIMCTPYERNRDYRLMATSMNGTIYLSKVETEEEVINRSQMTCDQLNMCSWGFKFEQYCTTPDPNIAPEVSEPVNEAKEFACIYRSQLNGISLMYGAEMDCIRSNVVIDLNDPKQLRAAEFVELKTTLCNKDQKQIRTFDNYKSLEWWSQSFLVGIRTILAGQRDNNGLAHEIIEYSVGELHRNKPWSPAAMCTFLSDFLHELQAVMQRIDDSHAVVMLDYKAGKSKFVYTVLRGADVKPLIPEWYRLLMSGDTYP